MSNPSKFRITQVLALVAVSIAAFAGLIGSAGAIPPPEGQGPEFQSQPPGADLLQVDVFELLPVNSVPSADVTVNCATNTIDVEIANPTADFIFTEVYADDVLLGGGLIGPDQLRLDSIMANENDVVDVMVSVLADGVIFDEDVTYDCALPDPAYEILTNCETGQAHARLINHGDDTAYIGVRYPDVMHMEIEVAPHTSEDWLLAVSPGESIDFEIKASNVVIGSEHLDFGCEVPQEPTPTPEVPAEVTPGPVESAEEAPEVEVPVEVSAEVQAPLDETPEAELPAEEAPETEETPDADLEQELAVGPEIVVSSAGSGKGMGVAIALVGLGLAALAAVAVATTRRPSKF